MIRVVERERTPVPSRPRLSEAQEDYLKSILALAADGDGAVATHQLSDRLGVTPASVTGMLQRLDQLGLVAYRPYRGVRLTDAGRRAALEIVRHHRLLETFLATTLGYRWDQVHAEAERLEHVISELFEERIAAVLGDPTHDPHGDPIPREDLTMPAPASSRPLTRLVAGSAGRLVRVAAQDADALALLSRLGLELGALLEVVDSSTAGVRVRMDGARYLLPNELAGALWIDHEEDPR